MYIFGASSSFATLLLYFTYIYFLFSKVFDRSRMRTKHYFVGYIY